MGTLREAVAHQHTQLLEAKAIIKQQGKELHDKDSEFEALKAEGATDWSGPFRRTAGGAHPRRRAAGAHGQGDGAAPTLVSGA